MRKHIMRTTPQVKLSNDVQWLPLERIASIELSSEDPVHPIESAFSPHSETGWRAASPGEQTLRLIFDTPQRLKRIYLAFVEDEVERSQEFVLRWSADGESFREIVRQQWNFSPDGSVQEVEDYEVELLHVTTLELIIMPDRSNGNAYASLAHLRLA